MIHYSIDIQISTETFIDLLERSGLSERRPVEDRQCIARMLENTDLLVTAWEGKLLVGVARSVTDFAYCCYLSDLAVDRDFQKRGIGRELIRLTQNELGDKCSLILLSAPAASKYYPHLGFEQHSSAWVLSQGKSEVKLPNVEAKHPSLKAETYLRILLCFCGIGCALAVVPLFMPRSWIHSIHEWLGLGGFPSQPIAEYLARFCSGLCAVYGGLLIQLSKNVRCYSGIIRYQAFAIMLLSLSLVFLGMFAGMPLVWLIIDAGSVWLVCTVSLWLQKYVKLY